MIILGLLVILLFSYPPWNAEAFQPSWPREFPPGSSEDALTTLRLQMVDCQIRARGISDERVLKALRTVPRHRFIDPDLVNVAYSDRPLPIDHCQTISQPYVVAYMTELARVSPDAIALEIGTGSGYQTAVLGELAKTVYSVERIPELAEQASKTLHHLGYTNIHIKADDGYQGWLSYAPYDVILVTAAPKQVPTTLIDQLAINGRLVIPVGGQYQKLLVITKTPTEILTEEIIPVRFVPMVRDADR